MPHKRDYSDLDEGEIPDPDPEQAPKRAKQQQQQHTSKSSRQHQNSYIDPTWGQKYVFSSNNGATTIPDGEESDFEDDADAMAYLASVRQEAYAIPQLLVAPKRQIGPQLPTELQANDDDDEPPIDRSIYHEGIPDSRGWYEDGAYMARPDSEPDEDEDAPDDGVTSKAVQEAYFASLLGSFGQLRSIVRASPPSGSKLPLGTPTSAELEHDKRETQLWVETLRKTDPHPLQIARLSKPSIIRILQIILGGKLLKQGHAVEERTSRWLWALLARLPDRGELDYSEIGWIRDLGRRAVLLGRSLAEMAALREELEEGALGMHEGGGSDEEEGQAHDHAEPRREPHTKHTAHQVEQDEAIAMPTPTGVNIGVEGTTNDGQEEGEIEEDEEDVAMDLASNSSADQPQAANLEEAKARLLGRLAEDAEADAAQVATDRSRMNMRATLNMILTVAGEFYGQRDLLEFREPFVGL